MPKPPEGCTAVQLPTEHPASWWWGGRAQLLLCRAWEGRNQFPALPKHQASVLQTGLNHSFRTKQRGFQGCAIYLGLNHAGRGAAVKLASSFRYRHVKADEHFIHKPLKYLDPHKNLCNKATDMPVCKFPMFLYSALSSVPGLYYCRNKRSQITGYVRKGGKSTHGLLFCTLWVAFL